MQRGRYFTRYHKLDTTENSLNLTGPHFLKDVNIYQAGGLETEALATNITGLRFLIVRPNKATSIKCGDRRCGPFEAKDRIPCHVYSYTRFPPILATSGIAMGCVQSDK